MRRKILLQPAGGRWRIAGVAQRKQPACTAAVAVKDNARAVIDTGGCSTYRHLCRLHLLLRWRFLRLGLLWLLRFHLCFNAQRPGMGCVHVLWHLDAEDKVRSAHLDDWHQSR